MRNVNFANLETAIWVARLGSYTAAAEKLYTTQPAVSARMRELETGLGAKLFTRVGRGVELTLKGREFLEQVEPLLGKLEELTVAMGAGGGMTGRVRIGSGNISMCWFPNLVCRLQEILPGITYDVEIDVASRLLEKLASSKLDIALVAGPVDRHKFHAESLGYDRMLWVTTPSYLDKSWQQSLKAFLKGAPLWCVHKDSFFWTDAMRTVVEQGADPGHFNAISNMAAARDMVLGDSGIGLISETMVKQDLQEGTLLCVPELEQSGWVELSAVSMIDNATLWPFVDIIKLASEASSLTREPTG